MLGIIKDLKNNIKKLKLAFKTIIITQIITFLLVLAILVLVIILL